MLTFSPLAVGILIGILVVLIPILLGLIQRKALIRMAANKIMNNARAIYAGPHDLKTARLDDFPNLDRNYYERMTEQLTERGFTPMGDVEDATLTRQFPKLRTMIRFMAGDEGSIRTGFWHLAVPSRVGSANRDTRSIELVTEFSDHHYFFTSNSVRNVNQPPKEFDVIRMLPETPLDELLKTHRLRVKDYESSNSNGAEIIRFSSLNDIISSYQRALVIIADYRKSVGFVTRDEMRRLDRGRHPDTAEAVMDEIEKKKRKPD